jgi:hypothetical protein
MDRAAERATADLITVIRALTWSSGTDVGGRLPGMSVGTRVASPCVVVESLPVVRAFDDTHGSRWIGGVSHVLVGW